MAIHIEFNQVKNTDSVTEHINISMSELLKITDNKFPFHIHVSGHDDDYQVRINCTYLGKPLTSKATQKNLHRAISDTVSAMKTQVLRKSEKTR